MNIRPIPTLSGYFASPDGIIWTQKRKGGNDRSAGRLLSQPRPLKMNRSPGGYITVVLDIRGKTKRYQVHRLILMAFDRLPETGEVARHFPDPTKTNNCIDNLRWGTQADNARDRFFFIANRQEKPCSSCGETKHLSEFYKDKRSVNDGLQAQCKKCHMETSIKTRNPELKRKLNREYMRRKRQQDRYQTSFATLDLPPKYATGRGF